MTNPRYSYRTETTTDPDGIAAKYDFRDSTCEATARSYARRHSAKHQDCLQYAIRLDSKGQPIAQAVYINGCLSSTDGVWK